jgi:hypothetical protein
MKRENLVVPECYVDTNLMNVLLGKACNHQKGCATVCKQLDEKLADQFAIAVIDQDKRQPKATEQYDEIGRNSHLIVCKHKDRPHYLILINPAIERFILFAANELGVCLSDYQLPDDLDELKKLTKSVDAKDDTAFEHLFKHLRDASNIKCLYNLLHYLLDKRFDASDKEICKILRE